MNFKSCFFGLQNKVLCTFLIFSFIMCITVFSTIKDYNEIYVEFYELNKNVVPEYIALEHIKTNTILLTYITKNIVINTEDVDLNYFEKIHADLENDIIIYGNSKEKTIIIENTRELIFLCKNAVNIKKSEKDEEKLSPIITNIEKKQKELELLLNKAIDFETEKLESGDKKAYATHVAGIRNSLIANILVLFIGFIGCLYVSRRITKPIDELRRASMKIADGDSDAKFIKISTNDEIEVLANSFEKMAKQIISSRQKLQDYADNLEKKVEKKTVELKKEVETEKKTTKAMMHILVDFKKTNDILKEKEKELQIQAEELADRTVEAEEKSGMYEIVNKQLVEAQSQLKIFNQVLKEKIELRTENLRSEKEKVEKILKDKNDFIIRLSHDLRTPLTPLITLLPILENRLKDENKKYVSVCNKNIKYMKNLVLSTLNMARFDTNTVVFNFQKTDLKKLVEEFIEANTFEYKKANISFINNVKKMPLVICDDTKIMEVIQNICSNAMKYSPEGGPITFDSGITKNYITIKIKDSGMGMSEEVCRNMFVEFYRGDPSRHDLSCGLGMSISKRIITAHRGKIWAKSKGAGKGSTILFTLSLKQKKKTKTKK